MRFSSDSSNMYYTQYCLRNIPLKIKVERLIIPNDITMYFLLRNVQDINTKQVNNGKTKASSSTTAPLFEGSQNVHLFHNIDKSSHVLSSKMPSSQKLQETVKT